jgi:hypothetical protein
MNYVDPTGNVATLPPDYSNAGSRPTVSPYSQRAASYGNSTNSSGSGNIGNNNGERGKNDGANNGSTGTVTPPVAGGGPAVTPPVAGGGSNPYSNGSPDWSAEFGGNPTIPTNSQSSPNSNPSSPSNPLGGGGQNPTSIPGSNANPWKIVVTDTKVVKNASSLMGVGFTWTGRAYVELTKDYCKITNTGYVGPVGPYFESPTCIFVMNAKDQFRKANSFVSAGTTLSNAGKILGYASYAFMVIDVVVTFLNDQKAAVFLTLRYTVSTAAGIGTTAALAAPTLGTDLPIAVPAGILAGVLTNAGIGVIYDAFGIKDH